LRETYDLIIVEGAGSPVELNLRAGDIVNMALALYAQSPVRLVGDIDRGGIFAQLLGTLWLLEPEERELLKGFLVNKFRGDPSLFVDGVRILEERGGVPVLGVVPYLHNLSIPEEDAVYLDEPHEPESRSQPRAQVEIAVIRLPHIANFDDFDPLATEPGVRLCYVHALSELGNPQAIILPGTKSTLSDLTWLRTTGLADEIVRQATLGTAVVGICGGYQMLGRVIHDPDRVESGMKFAPGLGLLPVETVFVEHKETHRASGRVLGGPGWLAQAVGLVVNGYEIHMGRTPTREPWLALTERSGGATHIDDGACSADGRIWGCYLHGLFENADLRRVWLASLGWSAKDHMDLSVCDLVERLDRLADAVEAAIDMEQLGEIIWAS
jgi:adenosylcobyric acid synthase